MYCITGSEFRYADTSYCTEDLIRVVSHVGNILDEHPEVHIQPLIQHTIDQIQTNINASISDTEYSQLVRQNHFHILINLLDKVYAR